MATKMQNIGKLFADSRSRVILIITGIVIGFSLLHKRASLATSSANLQSAPSISSLPGGFDNPESVQYASLQTQQNQAEAKQALKTGTSAIPTIINSSTFSSGAQPFCPCPSPAATSGAGGSEAGLGFETLGRVESSSTALKPFELAGKMGGSAASGVVCADGTVRDSEGNIVGRTRTINWHSWR